MRLLFWSRNFEERNGPGQPHPAAADAHSPHLRASLYDFVELCVRVASAYHSDVPSLHKRVRLMLRQLSSKFEQWCVAAEAGRASGLCKLMPRLWDAHLQNRLAAHGEKLRKVFHFFSETSKGDPHALLGFNKVLQYFDKKCHIFNPQLAVKQATKIVSDMMRDEDVAPQHHTSNDLILLTYEEFHEMICRFAQKKVKDKEISVDEELANDVGEAHASIIGKFDHFVDEIFVEVAKVYKGRL
jgi:hypothetical protein